MTLQEANKFFLCAAYDGDRKRAREARKVDYCKAQFEWTCFMDALCKDGLISDKQFAKATFPAY